MKTLLILITVISEILSMVPTHRVDAAYSCNVNLSGTEVRMQGAIRAQQNYYFVSGNGLDIYCDGTARWTVDNEAKEVYIEPATGLDEFLTDPESYLGALSGLEIKNVRYSKPDADLSGYRFDTDSLDSSWVITDLR